MTPDHTPRRARNAGMLVAVARETFHYFLFGNLFLALCAALWAYSTYRVLDRPPGGVNGYLLAFIFAGVVVIYTLDRLVAASGDAVHHSGRHRWIAGRRRSLWALLACASAAGLATLPFVGWRVVALAAAAGAVSVAYSVPVRGRAAGGLKSVGVLKIFLISLVWTVVTTLLPVLDAGEPALGRDVALLFAERLLFVFAITLPFDLRDRHLDESAGVRTIPVRVGEGWSKALVAAAVVAYLTLKAVHYLPGSPVMLAPAALSAGYIGLLLAGLGRTDHDYYYSLLWDGAIMVQAVLALAFAHRGGV